MTELSIERIDVFQVDLPYSGGVYKLSGGGSTGASMRRLSGSNAVAPGWVDTDLNNRLRRKHAGSGRVSSLDRQDPPRRAHWKARRSGEPCGMASLIRGIFCDRTGLDD